MTYLELAKQDQKDEILLQISLEIYERLKRIAIQEKKSINEIVKEWIILRLNNEELK